MHSTGIKAIRVANSVVDHIVMIIFLLAIAIGCYALWDASQITQQASASQYTSYKPTADPLSFEELQLRNADVFSWLTVYGTNIDYPVVQSEDNYEYLNTNVLGEFSLTGAIYMDDMNARDFTDFNNIIYGHHMEKNVMFGDLDQFVQKAFFDSHKYGSLYFSGKEHGLEFFAFLEADAYDRQVYQPGVQGENAQQQYIAAIQSKALYYREIAVASNDNLVLLSTCASYATNGRYILVGRIVDTTFDNPFDNGDIANTVMGIDAKAPLFTRISQMPWWVWGLIGFLLLPPLLLIALSKIKNKRKEKLDEKNAISK